MEVPLEVVFKGLDSTDALRAAIERETAKLERYHDRITSCRVVIEAPSHHREKGGLFAVRIHMVVPGQQDVVVSRGPAKHHAHEDPHVTIRDAFDAARRQLQDVRRRMAGKVKTHETPPHGRVARLFPDYGFIETPDGREVYFHRNSVLTGSFDRLEVGAEVRFAEEAGEKGAQASTVHAVGKHHIAEPETG